MQRRRSGIYEFRRRLPSDLAGKLAPPNLPAAVSELINPATKRFKRELTVSLQTNDSRKAKIKDMREAVRVNELFGLAQRFLRGEVSDGDGLGTAAFPSVEEIESEVTAALLKQDDEARNEGELQRRLQTPEERAQWPDLGDVGFGTFGLTDLGLEMRGEEIAMFAADFRKALAKRQPDIVKGELHAYLKKHDIPIDPSSSFYREAGLAVLRAHVKAYDLMGRRQEGEDIKTPSHPVEAKGPKLSEAFAVWREGSPGRGGRKISPSTARECERAVRYFTEWHGDLRLGDITKEKARDFRNALARLPTRLSAKHRALPLRALLKAVPGDGEVVHAATVNKSLNLLAAVVSSAERDGNTDGIQGFSNPFHGLALIIDRRSEEGIRKPFSKNQLAALFSHGVYRHGVRPLGGGGEAAYWFPLIGLLSGARLNEIAQLRVRDLRQDAETGIWFFDIGTDGGRSIKTTSSRRQVPVHQDLIRLGLLRYRKQRLEADGESGSLWPDVKSADEAYRSTAWSKWFNRFLRTTVGIQDKAIVFHSFRHTFKRMARDTHLSEELHDTLTGHKGSGGVGRSYGTGFGLKALAEAMGKIAAPPSVSTLPEWSLPKGPIRQS